MTKPVTIPNTFATATTAIPLSQLDSDFSTVATALNDANTYSNYAADTGVANAYVVTLSGVSTTYSAGLRIQFKAGAANTGASTLNVNGGGTKNITFQDASALSSGTIAANAIVDVMYDGTQFLLMNDPAGATGGDVVGPASATDNAIVRFDGATGKLVQNSVVTIADSTGDISGVGTLNATTLDATNIEVTNIKAKDGTAAASIADSTGVISVTANPVLSGGTADGVLYLNGSKVATSGSALTFDGTKLGVGATAIAPLTVQNALGSGIDIVGQASDISQLRLRNQANNANLAYVYADSSAFEIGSGAAIPVKFTVNGSEQMRLTSTGLKSSIAGTNADPVFSYTSDTNTGIFFPAADKLGFTAGGGTDDMVLTTTGLGIGTSSPLTNLQIQATNQIVDSYGNIYVRTSNNQAINLGGQLCLGGAVTDTGTGNGVFGAIAGRKENSTASNYAGYLQFSTSASGGSTAERMRLDSSGNLGLGVTPSAWSSGKAEEVGNAGSALWGAGAGNIWMFSNIYYNSNYIYASTGNYGSAYQQVSGQHRWWNTATAGTAGGTASLTQALTLDSGGNLLLGTTSLGTTYGASAGVLKQTGGVFTERGQFGASGGSTTTITTLANASNNQTYLLSVRQSGAASNYVLSFVTAYGGSSSATRMVQDNTGGGVLDMNITVSGLTLQLVLGSGFGSTTWDYVLTRIG